MELPVSVGGLVFFKNGNILRIGFTVFASSPYKAAMEYRDKLLRTFETPIQNAVVIHSELRPDTPLFLQGFMEINLN